ncbi:ABC transporter substrate-binding protein [Paenibacillus hexagrammi]|uniref:ABC transporter substrate-binding protein n=1 Tax=Paenibacillus hexagrammi TaxID=2908839 RepID=A0ABY3SE22_9BACL|nr:ABC transporter substrate-binding protein [Paenibacillus sp. YPD9-1]UJF31670.1 ABC transporter substrate-binding protein [Paenibacillus sp. YPD9-1]
MQILTYYLELRSGFDPVIEGQPIRVTLEELAVKLYCSTRNVKLLLKKMSERQWIIWSPGRGRGNASELTFLKSAKDMLTQEVKELAGRGDYNGAIELLHKIDDGAALQDSFMEWLSGHFGYRSIDREELCSDILRFPVFKRIATLDPAHTFFAFDCHMMNHIFDTLVRYDQVKGTLRPHLAHSWEVSEDQLSWTFYLRKGVLFHHGREMTAEDVRYTVHRLQDPELCSGQSWLVNDIRDVEILNRYKVRFHLKQPNYLFVMQLTYTSTSIVPEDFCRDHQPLFGQLPIGTGPFRLRGMMSIPVSLLLLTGILI